MSPGLLLEGCTFSQHTQKTAAARLSYGVMGRALGSHGPTCRHLQLHPLPSSPVSKHSHRKLADTTFLSCLVYTRGLKVADTRAFILGVRRVLLGLPQHLGEGQLHVLVYCFQQEVPEQQGENAEH